MPLPKRLKLHSHRNNSHKQRESGEIPPLINGAEISVVGSEPKPDVDIADDCFQFLKVSDAAGFLLSARTISIYLARLNGSKFYKRWLRF